MDLNNFLVRPFVLCYLSLPIKFYSTYLSAFKADVKAFINYYLLRRRIKPFLKIPVSLTIVPTNICNANCVFCAYRFLNDKKQVMTLEIFKKVVDEYKELGGKNLMLSPTVGEALINNNFFELVKYAKKKGFYIYAFTNGILLNRNENYKKIINSGIDDIFISTGDINPKYEAEIFGISQELASEKISGLLNLLEYKALTNSKIVITLGFRAKRPFRKIWNTMKETEFKKYFDKNFFHIVFLTSYDNWCGNITQKNLLGIMRLKKRPMLRKYPCSSLWNVSILSNGDVRMCGCRIKETENDDLVIGNVSIDGLLTIFNNDKGQKILSDWIAGKVIDVCKDCTRYMYPNFIKRKFYKYFTKGFFYNIFKKM